MTAGVGLEGLTRRQPVGSDAVGDGVERCAQVSSGEADDDDDDDRDGSDHEAQLDRGNAVLGVLKPFVELDENWHEVTSCGVGRDDELCLQNPA